MTKEPDHFEQQLRICRSGTVPPSITVALRRAAALSTVHAATILPQTPFSARRFGINRVAPFQLVSVRQLFGNCQTTTICCYRLERYPRARFNTSFYSIFMQPGYRKAMEPPFVRSGQVGQLVVDTSAFAREADTLAAFAAFMALAHQHQARAIVLMGPDDGVPMSAAQLAGPDVVLQKPLKAAQLIEAIKAAPLGAGFQSKVA